MASNSNILSILTVECYKSCTDEWYQCPPLSCPKGSLAGITLGDKIFAIGGGDENNCTSCVEMLDPYLGKWVFGPSMTKKRFASAAREFNGSIYTVGRYDGECYLESAERYDPSEGYWGQLPRMIERRGCLSLAVINQQLYAMGGFDGKKMVSSVEIFDPRARSWVPGMPMRKPRGYAGSAMINDTFYMLGGVSPMGLKSWKFTLTPPVVQPNQDSVYSFWQGIRSTVPKEMVATWDCTTFAMLWCIWKERNRQIFSAASRPSHLLGIQIRKDRSAWLLYC